MWIGHSLNMTHAEQKEMVAHSEREVLKNTYIYILFFLIQMFY